MTEKLKIEVNQSEINISSESDYAELISVKEKANYKGNWSEVLFERLRNPIIHKQIVDLYYKGEMYLYEYFQTEAFMEQIALADGSKFLKDNKGSMYSVEYVKNFTPKTREQIEEELDILLTQITSYTDIDYSDNNPSDKSMGLMWLHPVTKDKPTILQWSLAEAHEKGHQLRSFNHDSYFDDYFSDAFDKSKFNLTEDEVAIQRSYRLRDSKQYSDTLPLTDEIIREDAFEYQFSAREIVERMSQLKNYFEMRGDEEFTHEHLEYARKHYLEDIGLDNQMTQFFACITPETEERFLWHMNNSGI